MSTLFLSWQNKAKSQLWFVIGRLDVTGSETSPLYQFMYVQGVNQASKHGFTPLPSFPELEKVYESPVLFPLFDNRIPKKSRPDYAEFIDRLNLDEHHQDAINILSRSGGQRATDNIETTALFLRTDDYHTVGFCPRYLCGEFNEFLKDHCDQSLVSVEKINPPPAPIQTRLLCKFEAPWPKGREPFSTKEYSPIPVLASV